MVVAGQLAAARLDLAQHAADHRAQRLLHDLVVGDQAVGGLVAHMPAQVAGRRGGVKRVVGTSA